MMKLKLQEFVAIRLIPILLFMLCAGVSLNAQKRIDGYKEIEALLNNNQTDQAQIRLKPLVAQEDWSAIPSYQMAKAYFLQIKYLELNDSLNREVFLDSLKLYAGRGKQAIGSKKSLRKDIPYWASLTGNTSAIDEAAVQERIALLEKEATEYVAAVGVMQGRLHLIETLYRNGEKSFYSMIPDADNMNYFYLTASEKELENLKGLANLGESLKKEASAYMEDAEKFGLPDRFRKVYTWQRIFPNGRNYHKLYDSELADVEVRLPDYKDWAGQLFAKIEDARQLGLQAKGYYGVWRKVADWEKGDLEEAKGNLSDWAKKMQEYGQTSGIEKVLGMLIDKGEFLYKKEQFAQLENSVFLHKKFRDQQIETLNDLLNTLEAKASVMPASMSSYAYRQEFVNALGSGTGTEPIVAFRDRIFDFVSQERQRLKAEKGFQVLPVEFPNVVNHAGKNIHLRPTLLSPDSLYEAGAYVTEAVVSYDKYAVFAKGKYRGADGQQRPFIAYIRQDGSVDWMQQFDMDLAGSYIYTEGLELVNSQSKLYYYHQIAGGELYLEAMDVSGQPLFKTPMPILPAARVFSTEVDAVWLVWVSDEMDAKGFHICSYKAINPAGEVIDSDKFLLKGNIVAVRAHAKGIYIVGNFTELEDWERKLHHSKAADATGTNSFILGVYPASIRTTKVFSSGSSAVYTNQVLFNPSMGAVQLFGVQGDFEIMPDGKAKGKSQWIDYGP